MQPETTVITNLIGTKMSLPKGTTDKTMERLFPETRSKVPFDEERRQTVYAILTDYGVITG